ASRLFRGRFIDALLTAQKAGVLDADPAGTQAQRAGRLRMLREHDWVVYAKPPAGGPAQVLDYLARYTHRVAISNERILGIEGDQIRLRVRPGPDHGRRTVSLPAQ
ncbi:transposase, partial [Acinetobacter baumannii]